MGVHRLSRYSFTAGFDEDDTFQLTDRTPFLYKFFEDTRLHEVKAGDTVFTLAAKYFAGLPRPAGLFWIICDFQPNQIIDPTIRLSVGRKLFIPSLRTVNEDVFAPERRVEAR